MIYLFFHKANLIRLAFGPLEIHGCGSCQPLRQDQTVEHQLGQGEMERAEYKENQTNREEQWDVILQLSDKDRKTFFSLHNNFMAFHLHNFNDQ
jgi:hypothetical protein